jgi:hypothetical protein
MPNIEDIYIYIYIYIYIERERERVNQCGRHEKCVQNFSWEPQVSHRP